MDDTTTSDTTLSESANIGPEIWSLDWFWQNGSNVFFALVIAFIGWTLSGIISRRVKQAMEKSPTIDSTLAPLLSQVIRYAILIVVFVAALSTLGVQTTSILAVLGAAGLAIALALQSTLSNIAAGVMLVWLRPFSVGEVIETSDVHGRVKQVGLFATRILTMDGLFVFVPNSNLWNTRITNYSKQKTRRIDLIVGIGYDDDISKAQTTLQKMVAAEKRALQKPEPIVVVDSLGDSAVNLRVRFWTKTTDYWDTLVETNRQTKLALDNEGISIPYPQLDIHRPD